MVILDKRGSLAYVFIVGLVGLFSMGLLYVVFNHVVIDELNPSLEESIINQDLPNYDHVQYKNDVWLSYWSAVPFVLVFAVMLFWFVNSIIESRIS